MLDVRVQISNINYENTLVSVYPLLEKKIHEMYNRHQAAQKQSIPILFLNRLDSATLPVFLSILSKLDYDQKNELVKYCFNSFVGKIESALKKNEWLREVDFGEIRLETFNGGLYLQARGIKPNYKSLLSNEKIQSIIRERFGGFTRFVSGGARVLLKLAPSKVEEILLEKIWTEENRRKVQIKAIEAIMQYGIEADIGEIIVQRDLGFTNYDPKQDKLYLPKSLQCVLVDAVAGYLREKAVQNNLTSGMAPTKVNSMTQGGKRNGRGR